MSALTEKMYELGARAAGVTNKELAEAAGIVSENAGGALSAAVKGGRMCKVKLPGTVTHYFTDKAVATAWALENHIAESDAKTKGPGKQAELARQAIRTFAKGAICSSVQLANLCGSTPEAIDRAFDPLVDAGKLQRVPTQRAGVNMFTYRFSALWVPKDDDFQFADAEGAPKAEISPVAPPKLKAKAVAAPAPVAAPGAPAQLKLVAASAPAPAAEQAPASQSGFALSQASNLGFRDATENTQTPDTLEALLGDVELTVIQATNSVFAINSRGEFVIDLGQGDVVRFLPAQALKLKRFLVSTTVLEDLVLETTA